MPRGRPPSGAPDLDAVRASIRRDFFGACHSLYRIDHRDGSGLHYADLWPHQRHMADDLLAQRRRGDPPRLLTLKTRRAGTSTASALWMFHEFYWQPRRHALVVAHHQTTTEFLYQIYQTIYDELPRELQIPLKKLNKKELACELPWGSNLIAQTAGYLDIGRGMTIQHAHLSEIDYWPDPETALDGILNTVHYHADTSIIIESTAAGAEGWLHHFWTESRQGKTGFACRFQAWFDVPEHRARPAPDFAVTAQEADWMREFSLDEPQICWYRHKMDETVAKQPWGGERKMRQEFPFTEQEAFQSSGQCVFPDQVLHSQRAFTEAIAGTEFIRLVPMPGGAFTEVPTDEVEADFVVYEKPDPRYFYSIGMDVGEGVGQSESVVSVCRYPGYVQAAEWASDHAGVDQAAFTVAYIAERYGGGNCLVVPEICKSGILVCFILGQLMGRYTVFQHRYLDRAGGKLTDKLGWDTNPSSKNMLAQVANLVFLRGLRSRAAGGEPEGVVHSAVLLEQMSRCLDVMPGKRWKAEGGKSDRIIAWLIAMMGAYLDYEGGTVAGVVSAGAARGEGTRGLPDPTFRWPGTFDTADEVFEGRLPSGVSQPHRVGDFDD